MTYSFYSLRIFLSALLVSLFFVASAQDKLSEAIRLNQIGFYPGASKIAVIYSRTATDFYIASPDLKKISFRGTLTAPVKSPFSDQQTRVADFSKFTNTGEYKLVVPGLGHSYSFEIKPKVHEELAKASIKAFYFHRLSVQLPERYAGKWHRPLGHPDTEVLIHASAGSANHPEGTMIRSPRGWYDAGDYNKYIVNSGITMGTLLAAYEDFPAYWNSVSLNIPESTNQVPDLLDEALWNLRWMLTMQDDDGGVYHKLTNADFDGMVMPHKATNVRYVVQKSTAATLDFAAVMAQSARVYKSFENYFPGLADSCLRAAENAWGWAIKNPAVAYKQEELNKNFNPDITTGAYGDRDFTDEFAWAAAELLLTTKDAAYGEKIIVLPPSQMLLPSWSQVRLLGYYSLARHENVAAPLLQNKMEAIRENVVRFADALSKGTEQHYLRTVMGKTASDYIWGSSAVAANQSIALLQAYRVSKEKKYLEHALSNLDFLLGRNATGYCFVTGYGDKSPMHPHHRPSEADGVVEPVPGWLAGGPNPGRQDKCHYPSAVPDEAYIDDVCSYASNEVAINWNAPLVYVAGAVEALQHATTPHK